jgi:hypothetical protein
MESNNSTQISRFLFYLIFSEETFGKIPLETNKILELVFLINNHECDSPNIQIQKLKNMWK